MLMYLRTSEKMIHASDQNNHRSDLTVTSIDPHNQPANAQMKVNPLVFF